MKNLLIVGAFLASIFAASSAIAADGRICFYNKTGITNKLFTYAIDSSDGSTAGGPVNGAKGLNCIGFPFIGSAVSAVRVAEWGYAPKDVSNSYISQCGSSVGKNYSYSGDIYGSGQNLTITCHRSPA